MPASLCCQLHQPSELVVGGPATAVLSGTLIGSIGPRGARKESPGVATKDVTEPPLPRLQREKFGNVGQLPSIADAYAVPGG